MATTYTLADFTPQAVPSVLKKDIGRLVAKAVSLGWKFMVKEDNNATLIAPPPNEYQTIHLSARRNSGPLRRLEAKIIKYADPALVQPVVVKPVKPDELDEPDVEVIEEAVPSVAAEPYVVTEGPMISEGGAGRTYESEHGTQKEWSDGTLTYHCTRCDFTAKTQYGMGSHQKVHKSEPVRTLAPATPVDSLAAALVKRMEQGLDWSDLHQAAHELAEAATDWGLTRSRADDKRHNKDADLIAQIRALVGVSDDHDEVVELKKKNLLLTVQLESAAAEKERALSSLSTLRDLINEEAR